ncbi:MAG: magnesium transporter [Bacteroidales bacterium]|jgi:magnesium transporter|nr:magnesium transporter [Bacteroidales bacterium]MDI9593205.1 magnesium transporter [Bacteroidota bacterium]NLH34234.1 magnesium transporter [Lentimicrobium sp.]OQC37874.1 MAG: Magnesium transporter MgtE [Bacteroidetes bacterium ADurb.Bin041]MBP7873999.1 magnesium transporter [Bacteroidales bacterium]
MTNHTVLSKLHPTDIAAIIESQKDNEQLISFLMLPKDLKANVFSYFSPTMQEEMVQKLGSTQTAEILENMAPDDRTEILENIPDELVKESINLLSDKEKDIALTLLGYPEGCVARLMTPYYVQAKKDWTIKKTFEHIKKYGKKAETLNFVYVVDDHNKLIDDIRIGKLLMSDEKHTLESILDYEYKSLITTMSKEDAIHYFDKYDRAALPVTTIDGTLVGIVTFDDIMDEIEKRDTEDFQKLGGVEALELSYTETPLFTLVRKRAFWLTILFVGEMFTTSALRYFESEIAAAVVLVLFIPLIISSGGNSGSQASTLIVRAMALKELTLKDWFYVIRKELLSGLMLGLILGTVGLLRIVIWQTAGFYDYGDHWLQLGFTIFFSLIGVVLWGTISGSMIPLILKKAGLDPATSSAPLVATLVDVTGIIIYFSVAALLLTGRLM